MTPISLREKYVANFAPEDGGGSGGAASSPAPSSPGPAGGSEASSSASGASTTPSGSPSQPEPRTVESSTERPSSPDSVEDFFSGLTFDGDGTVEIAPAAQSAPEQPSTPPTEAQPRVAPSPPQQPVTPPTPTVPTPGVQPEQVQGQATGLPPPWEPGKLAEAIHAQSEALISQLAAKDFALSKEDVEELETDATTAVPKLLARLYVKMQASVLQQLQTIVPAMQERGLQSYRSANENLDRFFGAWPQLDKVQHRQLTLETAKLYRQMNPAATTEKMIEDVGALVALKAGLPLAKMAAQTAQPNRPSVQRPSSNGGQPSGFVPAVGGPAAIQQPGQENPWSGMYNEE